MHLTDIFGNAGLHSGVCSKGWCSQHCQATRLTELPDLSWTAHATHLVVSELCWTLLPHWMAAQVTLAALYRPNEGWELGLPAYGIIQPFQTRWNSTLHMLQRCALSICCTVGYRVQSDSGTTWGSDTGNEPSASWMILSVSVSEADAATGGTLWKTMLGKAILHDWRGKVFGRLSPTSPEIRESERMAERSSCTWIGEKKHWRRMVKRRSSKKRKQMTPLRLLCIVCMSVVEYPAWERNEMRLQKTAAPARKYLCPTASTVPSERGVQGGRDPVQPLCRECWQAVFSSVIPSFSADCEGKIRAQKKKT